MSSSFPKVRGFKKDKRNLIESTNNLVVFGQSQTPQEVTGNKGRRLLRRGSLRQRRNSKPKSVFPTACSTTQKLDRLVRKVDLTNYFSNTKPWNNPSNKTSDLLEEPLQNLDNNPTHSEILNNDSVPSTSRKRGGASSVQTVPPLSSMQSQVGVISCTGSPLMVQQQCPSMTFVNDIVCPVCLKGFEPFIYTRVPVSDVMRHSLAAHQHQNGEILRKNLEDGWMASATPKCNVDPQDVVVVANCGELFHRLCLRDWCSRGHRKSPRSSKPIANCPSCGKELKYLMCQEIEILRCFSRDPTMLAKEFIKVKHVNKELQILWPETNNYLAKIKREIQDTETLYEQLRSKRRGVKSELKKLTADDLGIVMANVTDINTLKTSLAKQEKALEFMQQETLQIMRMYLLTIIRKLKDCDIPVPPSGDYTSILEYTNLIGRIPVSLAPYLQSIVNDNEALSLLSRILAPYRDNGVDEAQQKYLEMELLQKFIHPKSPPNLTRPNTYVVSSSAPEVGESDSDDMMIRNVGSTSSIDQKQKKVNASSLKASTATHEISTIPSESKQKNLLRAPTLSNLSVLHRDKPPQLLKVLEIDSSSSTIDSSLLEARLTGMDFSPNGGGSVDKTYTGDPSSPSLSSPSSAQHFVELGESSFVELSKESLTSSILGETSFHYEQDSKYVRAIRDLLSQTSSKCNKVPPVSVATQNSGLHSAVSSMPQVVREIIRLHTARIATAESEQASSTNSETVQLNNMLLSFMKQQQHMNLDKNATKDSIDTGGNTEKAISDSQNGVVIVELSSSEKASENDSSNGSMDSEGKARSKVEGEDGSWQTLDNDGAATSCKPSKSIPSNGSPPPETKLLNPSLEANSVNGNKKISTIEITGSCEPVYTAGYQQTSSPDPVHSNCASVKEEAITPKKLEELSIAIMYIIEDDEDGDDEEEAEDNSREENSNKTPLKTEPEDASNDQDLLPPPLPTKVLSPIYLTAEKSSRYSIIADKGDTAPPPPPASASCSDMYGDLVWPRRSRMILVDTPSDIKINCSDTDITAFYNTCKTPPLYPNVNYKLHRVSRKSVTSFLLPPLPEEIMMPQRGTSDSVVPTLYYENETTGLVNSSTNKKLPGN